MDELLTAARAVIEEWDAYIGHDDVEGHDDAWAVGERIALLRDAVNRHSPSDPHSPSDRPQR
jgi:hypothetical protein